MSDAATLPIWILYLFCIVLIGIITLVYSRGNWRTALAFVGMATFVILTINGIDAWSFYIKTHFVGQFDQLGIPFRSAGPGWPLVPASWPLWLVPTGIFSGLAVIAGWMARNLLTARPHHQKLIDSTIVPPNAIETSLVPPKAVDAEIEQPLKNLSRQLEMESVRQELNSAKEKLAVAIEIAEEQVDKNQDLEIKLSQMEEERQENIQDFEDRISALELEIAAKGANNEELTSLTLQQAEEIARLKDQIENPAQL